jgi:hypothetical protein
VGSLASRLALAVERARQRLPELFGLLPDFVRHHTSEEGDYDLSRAGWIGDYVDPNTFLYLWVTNGGNNQTGWGDPVYDRLIRAAAGVGPSPRAPGWRAGRAGRVRCAAPVLAQRGQARPRPPRSCAQLRRPGAMPSRDRSLLRDGGLVSPRVAGSSSGSRTGGRPQDVHRSGALRRGRGGGRALLALALAAIAAIAMLHSA